MTQEEKAKAYDEALEKAKKFHTPYSNNSNLKAVLELIFPELEESEDERIRKALVDMVKRETGFTGFPSQGQVLAYLERQKNLFKYGPGLYLYDGEHTECCGFQVTKEPRDFRKFYGEIANSEWFKENYKGKSLGEEQKPEWTEEDEKMWVDIKGKMIYGSFIPFDEILWLESRLKSLRPTHWKPSEYHLSALLAILNYPDNIGSQTCQLALTDLYEQLKKLKEDKK